VSGPKLSELVQGQELPAQSFPLSRADLVRYAGASGDFNPIHWNDRFAREVGLPGVIAHGMLTMATAIRVVTDWVGDSAAVLEYRTKFTNPVPVPDLDSAQLTVTAIIAVVDHLAQTVRVDLTATIPGPSGAPQAVLGRARAVVRLGR
jgi:acyl dehydratase